MPMFWSPSCLAEIGIIDLQDEDLHIEFDEQSKEDASNWSYKNNDDGRITSLIVGGELKW